MEGGGEVGQVESGKENGQCRDARGGRGWGQVQEKYRRLAQGLTGHSGFYSGDPLEGFGKLT